MESPPALRSRRARKDHPKTGLSVMEEVKRLRQEIADDEDAPPSRKRRVSLSTEADEEGQVHDGDVGAMFEVGGAVLTDSRDFGTLVFTDKDVVSVRGPPCAEVLEKMRSYKANIQARVDLEFQRACRAIAKEHQRVEDEVHDLLQSAKGELEALDAEQEGVRRQLHSELTAALDKVAAEYRCKTGEMEASYDRTRVLLAKDYTARLESIKGEQYLSKIKLNTGLLGEVMGQLGGVPLV